MPTASHQTLPADWWPRRWTLLDSAPASALANMATDLALLRRAAAAGRATLRLYAWEQPTVSFGRHEAVRGVWDAQAMGAAGLQVIRRPTGGRALLHAHEVTYSVTLPVSADVPWRDVYDTVNRLLLQALHSLGAPVYQSSHKSTVLPNGALCFSDPSEGELMLGDQKIAGSAVWRANGAYLQHGSILLRNTQRSLERFRVANSQDHTRSPNALLQTASEAAPPPTAPRASEQEEALPLSVEHPWSDAAAIAQALRDTWRKQARDICDFEPSPEDTNALTIARGELATPDWLWRR